MNHWLLAVALLFYVFVSLASCETIDDCEINEAEHSASCDFCSGCGGDVNDTEGAACSPDGRRCYRFNYNCHPSDWIRYPEGILPWPPEGELGRLGICEYERDEARKPELRVTCGFCINASSAPRPACSPSGEWCFVFTTSCIPDRWVDTPVEEFPPKNGGL